MICKHANKGIIISLRVTTFNAFLNIKKLIWNADLIRFPISEFINWDLLWA